MNIEELRKLNEDKLEELKKRGNSINTQDIEMKIQSTIKKILQNDQIFFSMNMNESLKLLKCLFDVDDLELLSIYNDLISPKQFKPAQKNTQEKSNEDGR